MICRLCLITLNLENSVPLFNEFDSGDAPQLLTIIEKYLHLLITWDDEISTNICSKCSQHLHEFDKYCVFVREQQMKLSQETPIAVEQNVDSRKKRIKRELDKDKMAEKIQVQCEPDENVKLKEHIKCEIDEDIFLKEIQNQSEPDEEPDEIVTNKLNPQCEPDEQIEPREIQIKCEPEKAVVQEIDLQLDPQSVIKSSATSSRSDYTSMTSPKVFDIDENYIEFDDDMGAGSILNFSTKKVEQSCEHLPLKRKKFDVTNFSGSREKENIENGTFNKEAMSILRTILEKQKCLENRMTQLEIAVHQKMIDKSEVMAQNKVMRECKAILKKVHHCFSGRMTGEIQDEVYVEIAASFPLATLDAAHEIEEKLSNAEYASSVKTYIFNIKGYSGEIEGILKSLITDELMQYFNWSGSWGKRSLNKMKLFNEILYDVFNKEGRINFEATIKKCIDKSHNRIKQKNFNKKKQNTS